MYVPHKFQFTDQQEMIGFMKQHSFAPIICQGGGRPMATHLPFDIDDTTGTLRLSSHMAIANEQVQFINQGTCLVIFSAPHAYISPVHYDRVESVPTWDYVAVHAYGKATVIREQQAVELALERMISSYDQAYLDQWKDLSEKFKKGMAAGITLFEISVTELQGQKKLSQNKTDAERARILAHLKQQGDGSERELARWIEKQ